MADELTLGCSMAYDDGTTSDAISLSDILATISTLRMSRIKQNIGITEEAINLGDISAPGFAVFVNLDATNFIELRVATSGAKFAKLKPGEFAMLRLGSGAQVPYAIADTAACDMLSFISSS